MKQILIVIVADVLIFWMGYTVGHERGYQTGHLRPEEVLDIEERAFVYGQLEELLTGSSTDEQQLQCKELPTIDNLHPKGWVNLEPEFTITIDDVCRLHKAEN